MNVNVRLFAAARQLANTETICLSFEQSPTINDVKQALIQRYPELGPLLEQTRFALDSKYVPDETAVDDGQEIACIPPVSGG